MNINPELLVLIGSIVIMTVGFILTIVQFYFYAKSIKTNDWIVAKGQIVSSKLETLKDMSGDTFEDSYRPSISYKYEISGSLFKSDKIFYGDRVYTNYKHRSKKLLKKFPENKEVNIFVNPLDNSESVLIKGIRARNLINIFICVAVFAAGLFIYQNQVIIINLMK